MTSISATEHVGTYTRYCAGCRCEACSQAAREYRQRQRHRVPTLPRDTAATDDARRSRRVRTTRAQTVVVTRREIERWREADGEARRPSTRAACAEIERPCPFVSCAHNLFLDVTRTGNLKFNFPDAEPDEIAESCCLDVADRGGATEDTVAAAMNLTRARIQQIEARALLKIGRSTHRDVLRALID